MPRDSLHQQAKEAFADPAWRRTLGHAVSVRAADNAPDPARGLQGYVTTYQSVAAFPDLHLAEFRRHRTLLVLDEVHHLPARSDMASDTLADPATPDIAAGWSRALLPLLEPPAFACCCPAHCSAPTVATSCSCLTERALG